MRKTEYTIRSSIFLWQGNAAWHFVSIPKKQSAELKKHFGAVAKGWGSIPVSILLGKTRWKTSIFPDNTSGTYLLPLKAAVRKKEGLSCGDTVRFLLQVLA